MLVLPLRSPQYPRGRQDQNDDSHTKPMQRQRTIDSQSTTDVQRQASNAMLSVMFNPRPGPKRPKLSLETSNVTSAPAGQRPKISDRVNDSTQSPTVGNTRANTFDIASDTTVTSQKRSPLREIRSIEVSPSFSNVSATTSSSSRTSPSPTAATYCLPMGTHSILRNSPLPRRLVPSATTRAAKVLFPRIKRVCFREQLEELIPTAIINKTSDTSDMSDSDTSDKRLEDEIAERRALDDLLEEDIATTAVLGRRKRRRRDWIWRPLDDNISLSQNHRLSNSGETTGDVRHRKRVPELKREMTACELSTDRKGTDVGGWAAGHSVIESWITAEEAPIINAGGCEMSEGYCDLVAA